MEYWGKLSAFYLLNLRILFYLSRISATVYGKNAQKLIFTLFTTPFPKNSRMNRHQKDFHMQKISYHSPWR